jgi:glycosyltransferase involved in cell wall biosynthesis
MSIYKIVILGIIVIIVILILVIVNRINVKAKARKILRQGYASMKHSKVLICGITRDNERTIRGTLKRIDKLKKRFEDYRIVIYENDSIDGTKELLESWAKKDEKIILISENRKIESAMKQGGPFGVKRFQVLAECRNKYRDVINRPEFEDFDKVIIVDMDLKNWDLDGIAHSFAQSDWDMIFAFGKTPQGLYWDTLAYRDEEHPDTLNDANQRHILHTKLKKDANHPMIPAHSGFGGIAIYNKKAFKMCKYDGSKDCEHISLHQCMRDNGLYKIYMNPAMITQYDL